MAPSFLFSLGFALAAAVPLAMSQGAVAAFTLPKLVLLGFAVLTAASGALLSLRSGAVVPKRTALDLPLLAVALALAVSTFYSKDRLLSLLGMYNYYAYGLWVMGLCAGLYYLAAWTDEHSHRTILRFCLAVSSLVGFYGMLQVLRLDPFLGEGVLLGGRASSTLGSPISLGAYLALALPLGLHWSLDGRERTFGRLCAAALAAGLLASVARGAWLGAAAGVLAYAVWTRRLDAIWEDRKKRNAVLAAALLLAALAAGAIYNRFNYRNKAAESTRVEIWKAAWAVFQENPIVGTGPDTFELEFRRRKSEAHVRKARSSMEYQAHAHNDVLEVLATTGLLGGAAYLALLLCLLKAAAGALADPERRPWAAALCGGLLALFLNMKFNPVPLETLALASLFAGLLCRPPAPQGPAGWPGKAAAALLAAAALVSAGGAARLLAADRHVKAAQVLVAKGLPQPALRRFQDGLRLNRCEMSYHIAFVNYLSVQAAASRDLGVQRHLLALAAGSGAQAVACHPQMSLSHYSLGVAALMQARSGLSERLAVAEQELDAAIAMDPRMDSLLRTRLDTALLRGEPAQIQGFQRRLDELKVLPPR